MYKILVVDDEVVITTQLEERLTSIGYEVVGRASSGESAIKMARFLRPDLILMDIVMPGKLDGIDAAETIKAELDIPVIFLTAYADDKYVERAKSIEPSGYIVKPFHESEIKAAIEVALYRKDSERRLREFGESKAVLLDGFFSDIMLFLYTKSVKKEHLFKGGIEHGLKNGELCLYAFNHTTLRPYFKGDISSGKLRICEMKREMARLRDFIEDSCSLLEASDKYIAFRFLFDFSEIEDFEEVLAIKKVVIEKRNRLFPISGTFAFDIENLNAERTKVLSEGIPRVIISTGEETTISFSTSSYQPESLDVVPQKIIEEIVRKSVEPLVLTLLRKPMSGYDIIKEIYDRFHVLLPQARVYSLLYNLENREILKIKLEGKSKVYIPTEEGGKYIENKLKDFHVVYSHILGLEK
ncbi:MAG: response regulator [archaeon]|nr:response regulator [archaeon]